MNIVVSIKVVVIIGLVIFFIVCMVVLNGVLFLEILCFMFLIIMMVLFIIILIVKIRLNNDSVLSEKFISCIKVNVFISEIGIVMSGIIDVCYVCKNSIIISIINNIVLRSVLIIVLIEL